MLVLIGFAPVSAGLTGVLPPKYTHMHVRAHTHTRGHISFYESPRFSNLHVSFSLPLRGKLFLHSTICFILKYTFFSGNKWLVVYSFHEVLLVI